jgi:SsrA-binding protein
MSNKANGSKSGQKIICQNRRARHDYAIEERLEAGLALCGSEVKSLRNGHVQLGDAYVQINGNEAFLLGASIAHYTQANQLNHEPERKRKLLMHRHEIDKLAIATRQKGFVAIALSLYFNETGRAKLEIGIGKGKSKQDRRQTIKERDARRDIERTMLRHR